RGGASQAPTDAGREPLSEGIPRVTIRSPMPRELGRTTNPNAPASIATRAPLALHFVHPTELDGLVVELTPELELGREAPDTATESPQTSRSRPYAVIPHGTVSRRHAAIGESVGGVVPTLLD